MSDLPFSALKAGTWRRTIASRSAGDTFALGRALGAAIAEGDRGGTGAAIALVGELGSGKTVFAKGLAAGAGVSDAARVTSPTFVIRQEYRGRWRIVHYDVYRLSGAEEMLSLGFTEDLAPKTLVIVEWADRVASAMPPEALVIELEHRGLSPEDDVSGTSFTDAGRRSIEFAGSADRWSDILRRVLPSHPASSNLA
jgi:tRNA threonylcarbamoyladenosine biosynthesis protein TsaE